MTNPDVNERTHLDLFSGIGGFALAARANGVRTVQFVEIDPRCRDFLSKAWPGVPIHDDVRTFGLERSNSTTGGTEMQKRGLEGRTSAGWPITVWLLTGGVPCQPASRAGKQRGSADDRWLWSEAVRVVAAVKPTWALLENPLGIGDVGLAGILSAVEAEGYEVRVLSIPACAVGAPHRRERFWIVAHARCCRKSRTAESNGRKGAGTCLSPSGLCQTLTNHWSRYVWLPCADGKVRRAPDDSFSLVDGLHRSLLGALGNSIVPQVAQEIIAAMISSEP